MDKKGTLDTRQSGGGLGTKTATREISVAIPRGAVFMDALPGQTRDDELTLGRFSHAVDKELAATFGDAGGWKIHWQYTDDGGTAPTVLIDGSPPTTDEEVNLVRNVNRAIASVKNAGEYQAYK